MGGMGDQPAEAERPMNPILRLCEDRQRGVVAEMIHALGPRVGNREVVPVLVELEVAVPRLMPASR